LLAQFLKTFHKPALVVLQQTG